MTDEKPLHVQVAEALGWSLALDSAEREAGRGCGGTEFWIPPGEKYRSYCNKCAPENAPPPYGSDSPEGWACTGPLLEQFDIGVDPSYGGNIPEFPWVCCGGLRDAREGSGPAGWGHSPCEAIARCVVALAAAGKLPK